MLLDIYYNYWTFLGHDFMMWNMLLFMVRPVRFWALHFISGRWSNSLGAKICSKISSKRTNLGFIFTVMTSSEDYHWLVVEMCPSPPTRGETYMVLHVAATWYRENPPFNWVRGSTHRPTERGGGSRWYFPGATKLVSRKGAPWGF